MTTMKDRDFILKGSIAFSKDSHHIETMEGGYVICTDGVSKGVFQDVLPAGGYLREAAYL